MYEVQLNSEILHNVDTKSALRLSSGKMSEEVSQIPSFSFSVPIGNPLFSQELHDRKDIITMTNTMTGETEFEGCLLSHELSMDGSGRLCKKCVAEGFMGYLCDSTQMYKNYQDTRPIDFLVDLLDRHNQQVSPEKQIQMGQCNIEKSDYTRSKTTAYRTTLEEIKVNLIDRIGGEIQVRRTNGILYLDYLERIGEECSTPIELAKNIKTLDVKTDSSNIITRLIPLGTQLEAGESAERLTIESVNNGIPYIDDEEAIARFGIIVGTTEFDDITLPENLIKSGREYLENNNRIRKAYEAQVLDLSVLDNSKQSIRSGNTYPFKHGIFKVDEPLRIMKRTVDIYKPYSPTIQIGDKTEKITDIATRTAQLIEYEMPKQKIDILTAAKATASALIKSGFKGHVVANDEEVCIMDTPDKSTATKVWRWTMGGFGYSKNGYDGDYETAITMDGAIVANFITAGVLRGIEISNGDDTFHVLPDGTVVASAIQIKGGSINIKAGGEEENIIMLGYGNLHGSFSPYMLTYFNVGGGKTIVSANGIFGFSNHMDSASQTFTVQSATGDFHTSGAIYAAGTVSANDLYFSRDGVSTSLNGTITAINSEFDRLRGQIQTIFEMLDFITGGAG